MQWHSSLNLVSQLLKLCNIFIFGMRIVLGILVNVVRQGYIQERYMQIEEELNIRLVNITKIYMFLAFYHFVQTKLTTVFCQ